MLLNAKQETSRLLGEDAENRQARQMIMRRRGVRSNLKGLTLKRIDARSNVNDSAKAVVLCEYVIHVV